MEFIKKQNIIKESNSKKELEIPNPVWDLHELFKKADRKLFLVGGAVRDFVTGEEPKDFDLATDSTPKEMIDMFIDEFGLAKRITDKDGNDKEFELNNGIKLNLQGAKFGVLVVYNLEGLEEGVEIATFREDIGFGKETSVKVGATIEIDVLRRDINFNGLFYDLDKKEIIDLVGGVKDLEDKVVRMIGNPVDRIQEDKLRILRVMRFASRYESTIDKETSDAIMDNSKLTDVSQERIWEEFTKSFKQAKEFKTYLNFITEFNMWPEVFPGAKVSVVDYVETNNLAISLAQIFKNDNASTIKKELVKDFEAPAKLANKVEFLMNFKTLTPERVKLFVSNRDRFFITDDEITEWIEISNLNANIFRAFIGFEPKVNSREVMGDLGIEVNDKGNPKNPKDGQRLGLEINQRVIKQFKERL